jgi:DHA2 family multidrug resistance protein-like MFS transporter
MIAMSVVAHEEKVSPQYRVILWLAALGFFMQALDATIVNTALPSIAYSLHVDPLQMHDVVVAYVLTVAALIPISGWLADRFGIRTVYLSAIALFSLASLGCALAQNYSQLIIGRVFQGMGGAFLLPVARLALLRVLPRSQFLSAMGFIAIPGLVGPMIGPALGGFMVEYASWHWIFLINLPIGLLGLGFGLSHMPNTKLAHLPRFDGLGFILLVIGMVALSLGLESFAQRQYALWQIVLLLLLGSLALLAYVWHAKTDRRAIFRPELFQNIWFNIGVIGNIFTRLGSASMPFILPLTLQLALGFSPFQAGLMMMPMVLGSMLIKRFATYAIAHYGYYRVLTLNTTAVGLGIMSFAALGWHPNIYSQAVHLFLFGCVNSMQFTAMNTVTLKDLNQQQAANGNSLLFMVVNLCMSLGVALVGVLLHYFGGLSTEANPLWSFQWTYLVLGGITLMASSVFIQLKHHQDNHAGPA